MKRTHLIILFVIVAGLVGTGISLVGAEVVNRTGNDEFCGSCHVMEPMVVTFRQDTHGGNNRYGFKAQCVDCHLPHSSTVGYLFEKGKLGAHDFIVNFATDTSKIDWIALRERREEFVYDSGCLSCHTQLLNRVSASNPKSLEMHQHYQQLQQTDQPIACVSCHVTVGHNGALRSELNTIQPEYRFSYDLMNNQH